jgi:hypothetical protein
MSSSYSGSEADDSDSDSIVSVVSIPVTKPPPTHSHVPYKILRPELPCEIHDLKDLRVHPGHEPLFEVCLGSMQKKTRSDQNDDVCGTVRHLPRHPQREEICQALGVLASV